MSYKISEITGMQTGACVSRKHLFMCEGKHLVAQTHMLFLLSSC